MVRALALALALALVLGTAAAQLPPNPLDPALTDAKKQVVATRETVAGPALTREDVDITLDMQFRDVSFDTLHVIFGGGRFSANAHIDARIDLRVLAATRIQEGLEQVAPGSSNATAALAAQQTYLPADLFRTTFAGAALKEYQDEQEERLAEYLARSIPNVSVTNTIFEWSNVSPADSLERRGGLPSGPPESANEVNDPTFPPITLHASLDVEYIERTSLLQILDKVFEPRSEQEKEREKERKAEVADAAASYERSAFSLLGIRQVLDLAAPEGWDLVVHVTLPEGFTFEEASPDVDLARNLREAQVITLGSDAEDAVLNPVALTLSNRFIVSVAMLSTVLLLGTILRFPVLLGTNFVRRKLRR